MSICATAPPASAAPEPIFLRGYLPESAVSSADERRAYRQQGDSGRFVESFFCPICGTAVLFRAEGLPGTVGVPVGCFADPRFTKPSKLFWASRRHHWLDLPDDIALVDTQ
jgi:hypothetical protein